MLRALVLLTVLMAVTVTASDDRADPLVVHISPRVTLSPGLVDVTVRHTPTARDRGLRIEIDSDNFYRSSWQQLDGAAAPPLHSLHLTNLPIGDYVVQVAVERSDEADAERTARFSVVTNAITAGDRQ